MHVADLQKQASGSQVEQIIHLPDKRFVDWCGEHYAINRGVFNVIDRWFFDYGLTNILQRRQAMVQFLQHFHTVNKVDSKKMYVQFGKGGVKKSLYYFVNQCLK